MAKRAHAAANARVISAGLSTSAAFGMVTAMALTSMPASPDVADPWVDAVLPSAAAPVLPSVDLGLPPSSPATPPQVVVVKRRYITLPSGAATPPQPVAAATQVFETPVTSTSPRPAPTRAPAPAPRPVVTTTTTAPPPPAPAPRPSPPQARTRAS